MDSGSDTNCRLGITLTGQKEVLGIWVPIWMRACLKIQKDGTRSWESCREPAAKMAALPR
jgi:hypothetical protein